MNIEVDNRDIDLVEKLKNCPVGTMLYSIVHGNVIFERINSESDYTIRATIARSGDVLTFTRYGRLNIGYGECILFPSKTQRDWSKAKISLKEGTPVMVSSGGFEWVLAKYNSKEPLRNYVVPVSVFNFEFPHSKPLLNYGLLNP